MILQDILSYTHFDFRPTVLLQSNLMMTSFHGQNNTFNAEMHNLNKPIFD